MLSKGEIYLLNEALDGHEIYGLPKDKVMFLQEDEQDVLQSLIEKEIINDDNSINKLSYLIIKNLEKYKKARSYVWINDMVASLNDDDNEMYLFRKNDKNNEYIFEKTTNGILIYSILKQYPFLRKYREVEQVNKKSATFEEIMEEYIIDRKEDEIIIIRKDEGRIIKSTSFYSAYFEKDGICYEYNVIDKELSEINPKKARERIFEILNFEEKE